MFFFSFLPNVLYTQFLCNDILFNLKFNVSFLNKRRCVLLSVWSMLDQVFTVILDRIVFFKTFDKKIFKNFRALRFLCFNFNFYTFKVFKAYGINMRIFRLLKKRKNSNILFLRLGYSHGFFIKMSKFVFFRVFKRRYFLISGYDSNYINNLSNHLRSLRLFFGYKLIGIKLLRDVFKIKVGKKKSF